MELPTYTNIWRIEKRLYKLYDFRLPMPLPIGQIAVFLAIAVPYVLVLSLLGLPFSHTLLWVYVLPPGVLAWLTTRPVLEGKRLPELVHSQLRYVLEPRTWCRMAPLAEKDEIIVFCRVWRRAEPPSAPDLVVAPARVPARRERPIARPLAIASQASPGQASPGQAGRGQGGRGRVGQGQVSPGRLAPSWLAQDGDAPERVVPVPVVQGQAAAASAGQGRVGHGPPAWPSAPMRSAPGPAGQRPGQDWLAPGPAAQRSAAQGSARPEQDAARVRGVGSAARGPHVTAAGTAAAAGAQPPWPHADPAGSGLAAAWVPAGPQEAGRPAARPRPVIPGQLAPPAAPPTPARQPGGLQPPADDRRSAAGTPAAGTPNVGTPDAGTSGAGTSAAGTSAAGSSAERPNADRSVAAGPRSADQLPLAAGPPPGGGRPQDAPPSRPARPTVTVTGGLAAERPLRVVERALRSQPGQRPDGWHDRVVVVPGGHRPGKPDPLQRDRARARLPVDGPRRIVVLGCTRGAGQTTTALLAADMLASLRAEPVAVLDLNPGRGSLSERAAAIPGLVPDRPDAASPAVASGIGAAGVPLAAPVAADVQLPGSGLQVITGSAAAQGGDDAGRLFDLVAARYRLTLADPAAGCVPRTLDVANQLVIVAPASAAAAGALAMTFEWLEAHGHGRLAATAITVLNGVSGPTSPHAEHAANVASGRCRAIVKLPWDNQLRGFSQTGAPGHPDAARETGAGALPVRAPAEPRGFGLLSPALNQAYTALAGVLIAGLADPGDLRSPGG